MTADDAKNLATCDGSGAVQQYIHEADSVAVRFYAWARRHYEQWPRAPRNESLIASVGPELIVHAYLMWKLVEPLLEPPPKPLANLFEPIAKIMIGGALLVGWNESECVVSQVSQ